MLTLGYKLQSICSPCVFAAGLQPSEGHSGSQDIPTCLREHPLLLPRTSTGLDRTAPPSVFHYYTQREVLEYSAPAICSSQDKAGDS